MDQFAKASCGSPKVCSVKETLPFRCKLPDTPTGLGLCLDFVGFRLFWHSGPDGDFDSELLIAAAAPTKVPDSSQFHQNVREQYLEAQKFLPT